MTFFTNEFTCFMLIFFIKIVHYFCSYYFKFLYSCAIVFNNTDFSVYSFNITVAQSFLCFSFCSFVFLNENDYDK